MRPPAPPLPASRLIAILAADATGYTRLMAIDDRLTVELLDAARAVFRSACAKEQGRVVDMAGDSVLLAFGSANAAVRCALAVQQRLAAGASIESGTLRLPFRIGVHLGDVIEKADGSVYGDGVNLAARLQALAEPDEVMVSQAIRDLIGARPIARFEDAGEHRLKNVAEPVRAWRALVPNAAQPAPAPAAAAGSLSFAGRFELQPHERRLLVDGQAAALGARAFDLLVELARQPGVLRTKNDLLQTVWPGVVVEEGNLATQISTLRKILGGELIATIPGRGYRFAARIDPVASTVRAASVGEPATHAAAPPPSPGRLRTNLPERLPRLIGRDDDLAALDGLVRDHALVSIVGAGGMGKTALAQAFLHARRTAYPHGVCWVDLAAVTDPAAVPATVIAALGLSAGSADPLQTLCGLCAPLQVLVALDNAEHLLDVTAGVAQALVDAAPGVRLLVTSQAPLKVAAERVHRLEALAVPQTPLPLVDALRFGAVGLFVDRAQAADSRFALTDAELPAVVGICRQLDGLALAIELAAARAPMLGVHRLAASMGERLRLLTGGRNRRAPARQQTLRATLEWSHGFLDAAERAVFRRLAVFAGSGSLAMIQQVVADPEDAGGDRLDAWAVLDALALLVDRSLVVAMTEGAAEPRYRLLETPRAYALERLREAGEEAALRRRHMVAMAAFCEAAWHALFSGDVGRDDWFRAFERDADNANEAMAHATTHGERVAGLQIGAALLQTAARDMPVARRQELADQCLDRIDDTVPLHLQVRTLRQAAVALDRTRVRQAQQLAQRALDVVIGSAELREDRPLRHLVLCQFSLSFSRGSSVHPDVSAALAEARRLEDPDWPPQRRYLRAMAEYWAVPSDSPTSMAWTRELLALDLAGGGTGFGMRGNLIDTALALGEAQAAAQTGEELMTELAGGRDENTLAFARINLAAACLALGKLARARELAQTGWPQGRLFGMQPYWAEYLALLAALEGRPRAAAGLAGYADAAYAAQEQAREPNEAAAHERACGIARAALGDVAFEQLVDAGRSLTDEQVERLAFADRDAA